MIGVLDTSYLINNKIIPSNITKLYTTDSVISEFKHIKSLELLNNLNIPIEKTFIENSYIKIVNGINFEKNLKLSIPDIEIVALTLQLSENNTFWITKENIEKVDDNKIICLTEDNGMKMALKLLGLSFLRDNSFNLRIYKYRCFACFKMYDEVKIFCKNCGHSTVTRISLRRNENGKYVCNFKKNYKYKENVLKDKKGKLIQSQDDRRYLQILRLKKFEDQK